VFSVTSKNINMYSDVLFIFIYLFSLEMVTIDVKIGLKFLNVFCH